MKEKWINDMRCKLEGHQVDPPPGLWDDICKQMGLSPEPVRKSAAKRLYWVAAAAVLALVGFFVFQNGNDRELPQQANAVSQQSVSKQSTLEQPTSQQLAETSPVEQESQEKAPLLALARHQAPVAESESVTKEEILPESDFPVEAQQTLDEPKQTSDESQQMPDEPQEILVESRQTENFALRAESLDNLPIAESNDVQAQNKWSLGLNASGGLLAVSNSVRTDDVNDLYNFYEGAEAGYPANMASYERYVPKHHLPVRFGLSVQFQLNNRLALHSGISYTYLYSEFNNRYFGNSYDQKLHYLGIPLGMTWQLWSASHFRFYLSAGAMLEKCVRTNLEEGEKPWQWSIDGAAGVEYGFTRQLGFYLQPSLGYYFDDGTPLEHYYSKHPWAPSIEFGLRLHLNE